MASTFAKSHLSNALAMTKPIRLISPLLLSVFSLLLLLLACGKEEAGPTVIKGRITDKKTGAPIEGVYIECIGFKGEGGNQIIEDFSVYSDNFGDYETMIPQEYRISFPRVYKPGYLPKIDPNGATTIQVGNINIVNVQIIPTDGFLRLKISNDMAQHDSIYLKIFSPTMSSEGLGVKGPNYPVVLASDAAHEEIFAFPSDEHVKIHWGFAKFVITGAPFVDSVFLPENDTTDFTISF